MSQRYDDVQSAYATAAAKYAQLVSMGESFAAEEVMADIKALERRLCTLEQEMVDPWQCLADNRHG